MQDIRMGVVGLGNMGSYHAHYLGNGDIPRAKLTALCDIDATKFHGYAADIPTFTSSEELIRSGLVDALIIATPHYFHTTIGIDALEQDLHVLVEKPISVHKADCQRLLAAHTNPKQVFAAMFNQRTDPHYQKIKSLLVQGELGELTRICWITTNWFRSEAYYASGGWRATWSGEGGGVLLNQCPHQLDLMQWMFGMPSQVRAFCKLGRWHNIEVEDQATAYLEYPNGASGVFIATTGEAPGTNRLEIAGERGKLVFEGDTLTFTRNEVPMTEFSRTTKEGFAIPDVWQCNIPLAPGCGRQHQGITHNFIDAILDGTPLIAPASEGINSVELANAMLYSSQTQSTVNMPLDSQAFEQELQRLIAGSKIKKTATVEVTGDFTKSFK